MNTLQFTEEQRDALVYALNCGVENAQYDSENAAYAETLEVLLEQVD